MKGKSILWISLFLISHCILGQQNDSIPPSWSYENGGYLELQNSNWLWHNPDFSTLAFPHQENMDWLQVVQFQNTLLNKMWLRMDSLQQQQKWQNQVYQQQIQQLELQVDELQKILIAIQRSSNGPVMTSIENQFMLDYNLPTEIPIYFMHKNASIEVETLMALNEIIELLSKETSSAVLLSGYANDHKTTTENVLLSQKRVEEVRNMLISSGISADRIIARYMGNLTDDGKRNFQKVNITFIQKP